MSLSAKKRRKATVCHNCGTPLLDHENYCPNCGQENNSKQASIRELSNDFLGDYLAFDSRLFRSIVPLILQPGRVTIEYLDGKRQRFIPPIRVFLFLSFLYFGLSFLTGIESGTFELSAGESEKVAQAVSDAFQRNFNILLFFFMPVFALIIGLFFRSEKRNYYVNFFVYSLHVFSVFFIIGIVQILLFMLFALIFSENVDAWASMIVQLLILAYVIFYGIVSMKRVFEKKYTVLRFIGVLVVSLIAFLLLILLASLLLVLIFNQ